MRIPFSEPVSPRYIHINHKTNQVHLLVPLVGGQEISTDNTCRSRWVVNNFFGGGALHELERYKKALKYDIQLLENGNAKREQKEDRLAQINAYIKSIQLMQNDFT